MLKKTVIFFVISLILYTVVPFTYAAKGNIVYTKDDCDYFIVETPLGFTLLEWFGGTLPSKGDVIVGDFESYGLKDIYNLTSDDEMSVYIEDYWLSKEDAIENYFDQCN